MSYAKTTFMESNQTLSYIPIPFFDDQQQTTTSHFSKKLDLNLYCIKRPQSTCFIRVTKSNMLAWGIEMHDMLVVEKHDALSIGDIVVLEQGEEFQLYEFISYQNNEFVFLSLDSSLNNIRTDSWLDLPIIGTVTNTIHQIKPRNKMKFAA